MPIFLNKIGLHLKFGSYVEWKRMKKWLKFQNNWDTMDNVINISKTQTLETGSHAESLCITLIKKIPSDFQKPFPPHYPPYTAFSKMLFFFR